jgi:anti-anti-sigma factor
MAQHELLTVSRIGHAVVVRFLFVWQSYWYDPTAIYEVRGLLDSLLQTTDAKAVVLNLAAVHGFSAAGIGMLVRLHKQAQAKGIAFRLSNLQPHVKECIQILMLDRLFTIDDDEADALAAFAKLDQMDGHRHDG